MSPSSLVLAIATIEVQVFATKSYAIPAVATGVSKPLCYG